MKSNCVLNDIVHYAIIAYFGNFWSRAAPGWKVNALLLLA